MVNKLKQYTFAIANSKFFNTLLGLLEQIAGDQENLLRVLTYHRVDEPDSHPWLEPGLISASPAAFEKQMSYLAANYQPVSLSDLLEVFNGKKLPHRAVLVTFDDAYCDFEQYAWPVLKRLHVPVVLFVPTAYPDHPERQFWWDTLYQALNFTSCTAVTTPFGRLLIDNRQQRLNVYAKLRNYIKTLPDNQALTLVQSICMELQVTPRENVVLGWDALRKLAVDGVTLGAHTQTHPIMNNITPEAMRQEVIGSIDDLHREVGVKPVAFAYPSGFHNREVVEVVRSTGIQLAFTTERGINVVGVTEPLRLERINVGFRATIPVLRAQLLSWAKPLYSVGKKKF